MKRTGCHLRRHRRRLLRNLYMKRTGPAVRTSCIPCGHVYGRSCLEKWLTQCRNRSAKCPQCGKRFKHKDIINLYAQEVAIPNSDLEKKISYLREEIGSLKKKVVRHDKMFDESTKRQNDGVSSKRQKLAEHSYEPANLEPSTPAKIILAYSNIEDFRYECATKLISSSKATKSLGITDRCTTYIFEQAIT